MISVSAKIRGFKGEVQAAIKAAAAEGALAIAQVIYKLSLEQVPVRTGNLRGSGRVEQFGKVVEGEEGVSAGSPDTADGSAAVVYGDHAVDYAVQVHEENRSYRRGKWQYLRDPAMESRELLAAGADAVEKRLAEAERASYAKMSAVRHYGPGGGRNSG